MINENFPLNGDVVTGSTMSISHILFSFEGRISRSVFWWGYLGLIIFSIPVLIVLGLALPTGDNGNPFSLILMLIIGIVDLLIYYVVLAISVKRLHDLNLSGWWILVPFLWLISGFIKGTAGPNKYGSDPLAKY